MLVLDRFSGGLGYGYEPGAGLGGSAGTRNVGKLAGGGRKSVDVSMQYGVDFSDVPVFLQRVKVEVWSPFHEREYGGLEHWRRGRAENKRGIGRKVEKEVW